MRRFPAGTSRQTRHCGGSAYPENFAGQGGLRKQADGAGRGRWSCLPGPQLCCVHCARLAATVMGAHAAPTLAPVRSDMTTHNARSGGGASRRRTWVARTRLCAGCAARQRATHGANEWRGAGAAPCPGARPGWRACRRASRARAPPGRSGPAASSRSPPTAPCAASTAAPGCCPPCPPAPPAQDVTPRPRQTPADPVARAVHHQGGTPRVLAGWLAAAW
jgi:hypothetical protein